VWEKKKKKTDVSKQLGKKKAEIQECRVRDTLTNAKSRQGGGERAGNRKKATKDLEKRPPYSTGTDKKGSKECERDKGQIGKKKMPTTSERWQGKRHSEQLSEVQPRQECENGKLTQEGLGGGKKRGGNEKL